MISYLINLVHDSKISRDMNPGVLLSWSTLEKEMGLVRHCWNHLFIKRLVTVLLVCISLRLCFFTSPAFKPWIDATYWKPHEEKCDLFTGRWISNPSGPTYTNATCQFIENPQNCMRNGRPDTGFLYWRWKPHGCNLPQFDAQHFLDRMRNRNWALIGDSILRNQAQSLLCILSRAEEPVEVYHDDELRNKRWHFTIHNFTLSLVWSPFLAKADTFENEDGVSTADVQLYLDTLDPVWTSQYQNFDYIIISTGQWYLKTSIYWENNMVLGCHYCPGKNLPEIKLEISYRKVLQSVLDFVTTSGHKPTVFYRAWTPSHFENGEWHNGGTCSRTGPYKEGEFSGSFVDQLMHGVELDVFGKGAATGSGNGVHLKLLNTYPLSLLRPDGHVGPYRKLHPFGNDKNAAVQNDCLHWCLPGPIDSWNDLVMQILMNE